MWTKFPHIALLLRLFVSSTVKDNKMLGYLRFSTYEDDHEYSASTLEVEAFGSIL